MLSIQCNSSFRPVHLACFLSLFVHAGLMLLTQWYWLDAYTATSLNGQTVFVQLRQSRDKSTNHELAPNLLNTQPTTKTKRVENNAKLTGFQGGGTKNSSPKEYVQTATRNENLLRLENETLPSTETITDRYVNDKGNLSDEEEKPVEAPFEISRISHQSPSLQVADSVELEKTSLHERNAGLLDEYMRTLQHWVKQHQRYPRKARMKQYEGIVLINFTVDEVGGIQQLLIDASSGIQILDRSALALFKGRTLPTPPAELDVSELNFVLPINYRLRSEI